MSETILKSASVKVMQSYNYCHFEASMSIENESGLTVLMDLYDYIEPTREQELADGIAKTA